ncbi:bifunctional metallophosphatase/5'-nucleotidase [Lentibacillus sediminis]|uniref:bifunctional metallophosphatase/5'-nucleotidase n=1 Tax=Lentibacillus sediminis TaxID=1940529 RepID=UPI001EFDD345|nr:bifunctional UDP-sugar hydrolase/5'-nucleotidase [Lentibacillus sediminis]
MQRNHTTLTILYTSDVHGHAMPISYGTNQPASIGLARYATAVKSTRSSREQVLVLDNGDLIQGTPLMTHYVKSHTDKENPMIGIMNQIGIEASVIGNHEFNFGKGILNNAIDQSRFPWLSANTLDKTSQEPYYGPPYIIKTLNNGVKAAIVGVTTHYIPNWESPAHIEGVQFADAFSTLKKQVEEIRSKERPDVLIAMYHGGFERDLESGEPTEELTGENQGYQMAMEIDGIDVLLTGHQHRKLTNFLRDVLVVQPGNNAQNYGEIQIELEQQDGKWTITDKQASLQPLKDVEAAPEILDYMEEMETSTQGWLDQPAGYIDGDMTIADPLKARLAKHPFIEFIQNVQMEASGADISVTSLLNNNSTGFSSVVTMRDIVANYMYPNTLVVLELTGADILAALEKSAEYFMLDENGEITVNPDYVEPKPQHYNYDMWEGITYTINVAKPVGSRIEDVRYQGEPLEENRTYKVVLNNYRASGGGNYIMFQHKPVVKEIQKDAVALIYGYFEKYGTVKAKATRNFTVIAES